jgi:hypothetical protein
MTTPRLLKLGTLFSVLLISTLVAACSSVVPAPNQVRNTRFPTVQGTSLEGKKVTIPDDLKGKPTLVLVGYIQRAQFDIDRWILGALQADVKASIIEVPTIAGMLPQMVQGFIDGGMRKGIPQSDWGSVVTVYEDAPKIIQALGNERPQSAYAVLLDKDGRIAWSSNIGYSASQILELKKVAEQLH